MKSKNYQHLIPLRISHLNEKAPNTERCAFGLTFKQRFRKYYKCDAKFGSINCMIR